MSATLLYRLVAERYPKFRDQRGTCGKLLSGYGEREFEAYLKCGLFEHRFLRLKGEFCQTEKLVAFSCKCREFSPICGSGRMGETAALLIDEVLPSGPIRQSALSLRFALRYLLAAWL